MSMTPFNGDMTQALKWMQNNAPNIQSLISQKAAWYSRFNDTFWGDWETNVFDLRTANNFGLMVWCIILGVPSQLFGLYPAGNAWAYGSERQNFVWNPTFSPSLPDPNTEGGNFYGGGNTTVIDIADVRYALQLRYVSLLSNGSVKWINQMLAFIFNDGEPWDTAAGEYFYLADSTIVPATGVPAVTKPYYMEYRVGPNMNFSAQFLNLLNEAQYGLMPSSAGISYAVIQE